MERAEQTFDKVRQKMLAARIEFMAQLARFNTKDLQRKSGNSQWTPLQTAYHLYLIDGLMLQQMRRIQIEDNPMLASIVELATTQLKSGKVPTKLDLILPKMGKRRQELFRYLATLTEDEWGRIFHHEQWGVHTMMQLALTLPLYDQQHGQWLASSRAEHSYIPRN